MLQIFVATPGDAKIIEVTVPENETVLKITSVLVTKLGLPLHGPDGNVMSYQFHHQQSNRLIKDDTTLANANVHNGDTLRIMPQIIAG
ncbi:MAG: EsaB/YukD family protein [Actinomycetes bacterium]|jgi:hypothetical protein